MSDFMEETHAQIALAALDANPNLPNVFDGKVPDGSIAPYVLIYCAVQWPRDGLGTALTARQVTVTTTYTCHCVGYNAAAARAVQAQVRETLLNLRPVITGRNCSPIKQDDATVPDRDESTGKLVMDAISVFSFTSTG